MRRLAAMLFLIACQKHDDTPATTTTPSATESTAPSAAPLATIEPTTSTAPSATASSPPPRTVSDEQAAALAKKLDNMQIQMLGVLAGDGGNAGALSSKDLPAVDLSALAAQPRDGGRGSTGDLRLGSGGGALRSGNPGGGLSGIGARDH